MPLAAPAELNSELDELEQNVQPTWEGLLHPYERIQDRLSKTWGAVSHLKVRREGCLEMRPCPACWIQQAGQDVQAPQCPSPP